MVLRNLTPGGFAYIWQSKWVGIIAIKTERTQIHFWSDVFAAFVSSYRKVPICGDAKRSKKCWWHCNIGPITLLLILKLHTGVCDETFNVNIKIVQTTQNVWNFIVGKSSLQEMANLRRLSGRFHTLIWSLGDTVQNLEFSRIIRESWQYCNITFSDQRNHSDGIVRR